MTAQAPRKATVPSSRAWRAVAARHDTIRSVLSTLAVAPREEQPSLARTLASELRDHQQVGEANRRAGRLVGEYVDLDAAVDLARSLTSLVPASRRFNSTRERLDRALASHVECEERRLRDE